ncbi:hypothetical protein EV361DRAFT_943382 [Lentinula raphanica]|nr:hypothetical protein EV361DRAFT_943382 [Lentinula raphanica]
MRLLLTPILYLGLLCPASVFVTPIRAYWRLIRLETSLVPFMPVMQKQLHWSTQLNSDFGNSTSRNLTSSRSRLQTICIMARKFCFHGSCQYSMLLARLSTN